MPAPPPPPAEPTEAQRAAEPARYWVQIATGIEDDALRFTYRQLASRIPEPFADHEAWATPFGETQKRLLVGPFESHAAARAFVATVAEEEIQSFAWRSAAGQAIERLYPAGQTPRPQRSASAAPARERAAPAPPPPPARPAQPARWWAQVGVGRERDRLRFTFRDFARQAPRAFRNRTGWFTAYGQTNRLLVGPFESRAAAQAFLNAAEQEANIQGLTFQSSNGQEVQQLGGR